MDRYGGKMQAFVTSKAKDTLEVASAIPIWDKDSFMQIKKNERVPIVHLEQYEEEYEDEEEIWIRRPHMYKNTNQAKF